MRTAWAHLIVSKPSTDPAPISIFMDNWLLSSGTASGARIACLGFPLDLDLALLPLGLDLRLLRLECRRWRLRLDSSSWSPGRQWHAHRALQTPRPCHCHCCCQRLRLLVVVCVPVIRQLRQQLLRQDRIARP